MAQRSVWDSPMAWPLGFGYPPLAVGIATLGAFFLVSGLSLIRGQWCRWLLCVRYVQLDMMTCFLRVRFSVQMFATVVDCRYSRQESGLCSKG